MKVLRQLSRCWIIMTWLIPFFIIISIKVNCAKTKQAQVGA